MKDLTQQIETIFKADLKDSSKRGKRNVVFARIALAEIARYKRGITLTKIGEMLGRDHATICHYLMRFNELYKFDIEFKELFNQIK